MAEENQFRIEKGMKVVDENEASVGTLDNIYAEDKTGLSRFISVDGRLLPVETIQGTEQDKVKLTLGQDKINSFPQHDVNKMPGQDEQRKAYDVIGLTGPAVNKE